MNRHRPDLPTVTPVDAAWRTRAEARQLTLTKPPGSLGRLEEIANRVVAIQETLSPCVARRRVCTLAADHGVVGEGVSAYPQAVTAQMVHNFLTGGAAVNALARAAGADVTVIDIGVATPIDASDRLVVRKVRPGSANIARGAAMTRDQAIEAITVGVDIAYQAADDGIQMIGLGDMGIGNSTTASAVTAALTNTPPEAVTGRGTGINDAMLAHKTAVVTEALRVNRPRADDPLDVLHKVGVTVIATAIPEDEELRERIATHRADRPVAWTTVEEPYDVVGAIRARPPDAPILVDCVTVWLSNLLWRHRALAPDKQQTLILDQVVAFGEVARLHTVVVVSNEVGSSVVPSHATARRFRDLQGLANQQLARDADRVVLLVAGLPLVLTHQADAAGPDQ